MTRNLVRTGRNGTRAFTLVEILIVVVILGILAAIVIPQFTDASQEAAANSTRSQLQTLRSQIELYKMRNVGDLPTDTNDLLDLSLLVSEGYLQSEPVNAMNGWDGVAAAPADGVGWVWTDADATVEATNKAGDGTMDW